MDFFNLEHIDLSQYPSLRSKYSLGYKSTPLFFCTMANPASNSIKQNFHLMFVFGLAHGDPPNI